MNILVTGNIENFNAVKRMIPERHAMTWLNPSEIKPGVAQSFNLIMDLDLDLHPEKLSLYASLTNRPVMCCAVRRSLAEITAFTGIEPECTLIGVNFLPGFLDRTHLEISTLRTHDADTVENICNTFGMSYTLVSDRVGMVSPRILCMIINEAAFLLQEKGATQKGIDTAMMLGVNYPKGPLAWADEIGIQNVVMVLQSVHRETGDDRYRVCPLLIRMAQLGESFYG